MSKEEKKETPKVKKFERNVVVFNSPYASRVLYLFVGDAKEPFRFHRKTLEILATDTARIQAVLDYIEVEKSLGQQTVFEKNEYEIMKDAEPVEVTMDVDGEKLMIPLSDMKDEWVKKYKAGLQADTGQPKIITGTKSSTS